MQTNISVAFGDYSSSIFVRSPKGRIQSLSKEPQKAANFNERTDRSSSHRPDTRAAIHLHFSVLPFILRLHFVLFRSFIVLVPISSFSTGMQGMRSSACLYNVVRPMHDIPLRFFVLVAYLASFPRTLQPPLLFISVKQAVLPPSERENNVKLILGYLKHRMVISSALGLAFTVLDFLRRFFVVVSSIEYQRTEGSFAEIALAKKFE